MGERGMLRLPRAGSGARVISRNISAHPSPPTPQTFIAAISGSPWRSEKPVPHAEGPRLYLSLLGMESGPRQGWGGRSRGSRQGESAPGPLSAHTREIKKKKRI